MVGPNAQRWWRVLARLDRSRAEAFRQDRPVRLRQVYARGSSLLRRDRAVLVGYLRHDVRLSRVRLDVAALRIVHREPGAVTVRVVERLASAVAVLPDGDRVALPVDAPTRRVLLIVHTIGGWRLAAVRRLAG